LTPKKSVLFLCTGNSCRSQMAEAIVNARLGDEWQASSAGSRPQGYVHPKAIEALAEIGIAHSGRSKSLDEFVQSDFDLVVTLCGTEAEGCPVWLGRGKVVHHAYPDPFSSGDVGAYRSIRDAMLKELPEILEQAGEEAR
jgi:arsenate reductase (thioredoxin)